MILIGFRKPNTFGKHVPLTRFHVTKSENVKNTLPEFYVLLSHLGKIHNAWFCLCSLLGVMLLIPNSLSLINITFTCLCNGCKNGQFSNSCATHRLWILIRSH